MKFLLMIIQQYHKTFIFNIMIMINHDVVLNMF